MKVPTLVWRFVGMPARFLICLVFVLASTMLEARPPNIVLVFTDDVGWGDPKCYNEKSKIPTPNIDKLAANGMRFTHAHTPAALCAPTRYSMLSGNYPWRGRTAGGTWGYNCSSQFKAGQKAFPLLLKPAGYRCAMFGKSGIGGHWGMTPGEDAKKTPAPIQWGFDYSYLIPRGHQASPFAFFENGITTSKLVGGKVSLKAADWDHAMVGQALLDRAVTFLEGHAKDHGDQPFFLHFCTAGAHGPYVPDDTLDGKPLKGATKMTDHTDMVHETDILLGALVKNLERLKLRENTLVIYTSDNGGLPFEREFGHDAVAGLRGSKSHVFEGGQRVPFVAAWPGHVPAGTVRHQLVGTHDLIATALDLADIPVPSDQALDSVSIAPVLLGKRDDTEPVRTTLLTQSSPGRGPFDDGGFKANSPKGPKSHKGSKKGGRMIAFAVYQGDWKLVIQSDGKAHALYNLSKDLGEESNLIGHPEQKQRVKTMSAEFKRIRTSKRST